MPGDDLVDNHRPAVFKCRKIDGFVDFCRQCLQVTMNFFDEGAPRRIARLDEFRANAEPTARANAFDKRLCAQRRDDPVHGGPREPERSHDFGLGHSCRCRPQKA